MCTHVHMYMYMRTKMKFNNCKKTKASYSGNSKGIFCPLPSGSTLLVGLIAACHDANLDEPCIDKTQQKHKDSDGLDCPRGGLHESGKRRQIAYQHAQWRQTQV